jgi:hypothetical protein
MVSTIRDEPDPPACPHLGLAADRRSHSTYPHPGHRCFVKERPAVADRSCQATFCLTNGYPECDRYKARRRTAREAEAPESRSNTPETGVYAFRVHVFHAGESLAGIAAAYALAARQIATANGIDPNDAFADGCRLVIPLAQSGQGAGLTRSRRRADRSG